MNEPYLYKRTCENIIYHIQTKLQMHLPDDVRHDIYTNVRQAVLDEAGRAKQQEENWKGSYVELRKKGFPLNWNELKIRLAREKEPIDPQLVLKWMILRENGIDIRRILPDDQLLLRELLEVHELLEV